MAKLLPQLHHHSRVITNPATSTAAMLASASKFAQTASMTHENGGSGDHRQSLVLRIPNIEKTENEQNDAMNTNDQNSTSQNNNTATDTPTHVQTMSVESTDDANMPDADQIDRVPDESHEKNAGESLVLDEEDEKANREVDAVMLKAAERRNHQQVSDDDDYEDKHIDDQSEGSYEPIESGASENEEEEQEVEQDTREQVNFDPEQREGESMMEDEEESHHRRKRARYGHA